MAGDILNDAGKKQFVVAVGNLCAFLENESKIKCLFEICGDGFQLLVRSYRKVGLIEGVFNVV